MHVYNPYLPGGEYVPDGEPRIFDERLYVFGSHDEANGDMFCLNDYVCWSAPLDDLAAWRYEGIIYKKNQDPANPDGKHLLFAPDVTQGPDGRYYLYYGLDFIPEISVAISDKPAGPYAFYGKVSYPGSINNGSVLRDDHPYDPSIFIDDDHRIFLYYGFAPGENFPFEGITPSRGGMVVELESDMLTAQAVPKVVLPSEVHAAGTGFENHAFFEAPSIRKINGTYYLLYSSSQGHELCYATSRLPDRGFAYGGSIISNGDIGLDGRTNPVNFIGNNHGGLVEVHGQWYIFYHRHTHGIPFSRQGCAEPVCIKADGSIPQVEITSCGLMPGRTLDACQDVPAWVACHLTGPAGARRIGVREHSREDEPLIFEENDSNMSRGKTQYVRNMVDQAVAGYKYLDFSSVKPVESVQVSMRARQSNQTGGHLLLTLDAPGLDGQKIASIPVQGNLVDWKQVQAPISGADGVHALYFTYYGQGSIDLADFKFQ